MSAAAYLLLRPAAMRSTALVPPCCLGGAMGGHSGGAGHGTCTTCGVTYKGSCGLYRRGVCMTRTTNCEPGK